MSEPEAGAFQGFPPSGSKLCPRCHVDLAGQALSGRCPQCGMTYDQETRVWSRSPLAGPIGKLLCVVLPLLTVILGWLTYVEFRGAQFFDIALIFMLGLPFTILGSFALFGIALGARQIVAVTGDCLVAIDMSGAPVIIPFTQLESVQVRRGKLRNQLVVEHLPVNVPRRRPTFLPTRGYPPALLEEIAAYANQRCSAFRKTAIKDQSDDSAVSASHQSETKFTGFGPGGDVLCPQCDYLLLGLPPAGACPECGCHYDDTSMVVEQTTARSDWFSTYVALPLNFFIQLLLILTGITTSSPILIYMALCVLVVIVISLITSKRRKRIKRPLIAVLPDGVLVRFMVRRPKWLDYEEIERLYFGSDTEFEPGSTDTRIGTVQIVHKPIAKNQMTPPKRTKVTLVGCARHDLQQLVQEGNRRLALLKEHPSKSSDV